MAALLAAFEQRRDLQPDALEPLLQSLPPCRAREFIDAAERVAGGGSAIDPQVVAPSSPRAVETNALRT